MSSPSGAVVRPHRTERERATSAAVLGVVLGVFLRLISRRRSA